MPAITTVTAAAAASVLSQAGQCPRAPAPQPAGWVRPGGQLQRRDAARLDLLRFRPHIRAEPLFQSGHGFSGLKHRARAASAREVVDFTVPRLTPGLPRSPLETLAVGSAGTDSALRLAHRDGARFVLASTSEIYGDPQVHPQPEDYWGNVNPIGRAASTAKPSGCRSTHLAYRWAGVDTGIVRIFNTYGPRMSADDGRIVTNFVSQALTGQPLTIYGGGSQTRSFCYVDDLVRGILAMLSSNEPGPINLGKPEEFSVADFAQLVLKITARLRRSSICRCPPTTPAAAPRSSPARSSCCGGSPRYR